MAAAPVVTCVIRCHLLIDLSLKDAILQDTNMNSIKCIKNHTQHDIFKIEMYMKCKIMYNLRSFVSSIVDKKKRFTKQIEASMLQHLDRENECVTEYYCI